MEAMSAASLVDLQNGQGISDIDICLHEPVFAPSPLIPASIHLQPTQLEEMEVLKKRGWSVLKSDGQNLIWIIPAKGSCFPLLRFDLEQFLAADQHQNGTTYCNRHLDLFWHQDQWSSA
jgi:hypothetical protein